MSAGQDSESKHAADLAVVWDKHHEDPRAEVVAWFVELICARARKPSQIRKAAEAQKRLREMGVVVQFPSKGQHALLSDLPLQVLRRSLADTEELVGGNDPSANVLRREIQRKEQIIREAGGIVPN